MRGSHLVDQHVEQGEEDGLADAEQQHGAKPVAAHHRVPQREEQLGRQKERHADMKPNPHRPA